MSIPEGGTVRALFVVVMMVGSVVAGVAASAPAHADPPCAQYDTCKWMPNPYNGGQLQPTWELPGGYGLPGGSPTVCDPQAYRCYPAAPGSGF
jgi:hypothetical protein